MGQTSLAAILPTVCGDEPRLNLQLAHKYLSIETLTTGKHPRRGGVAPKRDSDSVEPVVDRRQRTHHNRALARTISRPVNHFRTTTNELKNRRGRTLSARVAKTPRTLRDEGCK